MSRFSQVLTCEEDTTNLAVLIGSYIVNPLLISLSGPLGAGKTFFTRGLAIGLGATNPHAVHSPTFTLIHEYPARLPIYHFDLYRLNTAEELLEIGAAEYWTSNGVSVVEWGNRFCEILPTNRWDVTLEPLSPSERLITIEPTGDRETALLTRIIEKWTV
ncbi:MAG: tRNA (adenosine(37)-N6)-threonylcarbamoyltransferase complex ATPase subunit type 1 TsaE [Zavarzinella sp.]